MEWLQEELDARDWSQAELAQRANVTRAAINGVLKERRAAGVDLCRAIAQAFSIPEQEVFIRAGLMTRPKDYDPVTARLIHNITSLSPEERRIVETMINGLKHEKEPAKAAGLIVK